MRSREFKDTVFQQFARVAHAFSTPKRLEIVDVLSQGERDVETLAREIHSSVANTSGHLQVLRQARLVVARKQGVRVLYRLADPTVRRYWKGLQALAESRLPDVKDAVRRYIEERDGMEPITREELRRRIRRDEVIVLDVRPREEYELGHIPGAISVPVPELAERLKEIPPNLDVVAYCRGSYCVLSVEAVALLRKAGRRAVRLAEGLPEWREAGLEIETAEAEE